MKKTPRILLLVLPLFFAFSLCAQKVDKQGKTEGKPAQKAKQVRIPVYLGHSDLSGGPIAKTVFDSLLKQGLTSHDSAANIFKVDVFTFTYAERNLYEDSEGDLQYMMDYGSEVCHGDTITDNFTPSIYDRIKVGDTLYFDNIMLKSPQGWGANGKSMRFEITKQMP